jgi:bifunctional UDP-N-acetylglucosamine pyrophosphorylase/glucosamine-1-phosphate N-acetyltransferase
MTNGIAIILAAGEGERMNSDLPKVLHEAAGAPLLLHVGRAARDSGADRVVVVVGKGGDLVRQTFAAEHWEFVDQPERRGTGDAVRRAAPQLRGFEGDVLVLAGDVPLLEGATLAKLRAARDEAGAAVAVLTARIAEPRGYGRILRDGQGAFVGIVEEKDATPEQRAIDEVNSSVYCFRAADLLEALPRIGNGNAQGEYYLTDAVSILRDLGRVVVAVAAATPDEILGVNDAAQLNHVDVLLRRRATPPAAGHAPWSSLWIARSITSGRWGACGTSKTTRFTRTASSPSCRSTRTDRAISSCTAATRVTSS